MDSIKIKSSPKGAFNMCNLYPLIRTYVLFHFHYHHHYPDHDLNYLHQSYVARPAVVNVPPVLLRGARNFFVELAVVTAVDAQSFLVELEVVIAAGAHDQHYVAQTLSAEPVAAAAVVNDP